MILVKKIGVLIGIRHLTLVGAIMFVLLKDYHKVGKNIKIPLHFMSISVQSLSTHQRQQVVSINRNGNSRLGLHLYKAKHYFGYVTLFVLCVYKRVFLFFISQLFTKNGN